MRTTGLLFLMGTTVLTCSAGLAAAQAAPAPRAADPIANVPTTAQSGASTSGSLPTDIARQAQQENITVRGKTPSRNAIGGGLMVHQTAPKSSSTVTQAFIEKQAPGSNPFQLARLLPGVNATNPDPLGLTGGNVTIRGLQTSQVGVTLEGVPISDVGSAATYPQEILDSENTAQINIKQGSADLDSPVVNSSGGTISIYMRDPSIKPGGTLGFSYGSKSSTRGFARLDTGLIGHTNLRGYGSYSYTSSLMWRGPGHLEKQHADLKFVNDWGQGNRVGLSFVYNMLNNNQFPSVTLANWKTSGWGDANVYSNRYDGLASTSSRYPIGNYIGVRINPFTNIYVSAPSTFTLTNHLSFTTAPYLWYGYGNGGGGQVISNLASVQFGAAKYRATAYGKTTGPAAFYNPSITETWRPGINSKFTYDTGNNKAVLGYWFEYSKQRQTAPYSPILGNGNPLNVWGDQNELILSNGQPYEFRNQLTFTRIHTVYAGDTLSLLHSKLLLDAGLKYINIARDGQNFLPSVKTRYPSTRNDGYLPTGSVTYNINKYNSVFASVTTSFKMPSNFNLYESGSYIPATGYYSTRANPNQKPEVSISEELGYRYQGPVINGSITYFHYNFTNRQFSTQATDLNGTQYTTNISSGGQTSDGADFEIGTRPWHNLRPYVSAEVLHAVTDSNVQTGNMSGGVDYLPTTGKLAPFTPQFQTAFALDYDDGARFGEFNLKYVGHQYADYMNQQAINGYTTLNANIGYRFPNVWHLKSPTLMMNFVNLLNEHYLDGINSVQTNVNQTRGVYGTNIGAKTPTYSVGAGFAWFVSVRTDF